MAFLQNQESFRIIYPKQLIVFLQMIVLQALQLLAVCFFVSPFQFNDYHILNSELILLFTIQETTPISRMSFLGI